MVLNDLKREPDPSNQVIRYSTEELEIYRTTYIEPSEINIEEKKKRKTHDHIKIHFDE
jgi:hypothetical protein